MKYPEERILIIRPCLKTICLGVKPAAKLLSLLLYYARNCREDAATFTFTCTQADLLRDLIGEMDVKTLHNVAIPVLRLLGYVEVNGSSYRYEYTVDVALCQHAIDHCGDSEQLGKILIASIRQQLGNFPDQLGNFPNELGKILIELEKFLIPFRKIPNSSRGRKPASEGASGTISQSPRLLESNEIDKITGDDGVCALTSTPPASSSLQWDAYSSLDDTSALEISRPDEDEVDISDAETVHRMPAVRLPQKGQTDATTYPASGNPALQPDLAPDARSGEGCEPRAVAASAINASISAESAVPSDAPLGDFPFVSPTPSTASGPTPPVRGKGKRVTATSEPTLEEQLSEDERALYHEWCSLFRVAVPLTPSIAKAAKALASPLATWAELLKTERVEVLRQFRGWCFANDSKKGWYRSHGVKLYDLERELEAWQSAMQQQLEPETAPTPEPTVGRLTFYEKLPTPDAEWLATYYAQQRGVQA